MLSFRRPQCSLPRECGKACSGRRAASPNVVEAMQARTFRPWRSCRPRYCSSFSISFGDGLAAELSLLANGEVHGRGVAGTATSSPYSSCAEHGRDLLHRSSTTRSCFTTRLTLTDLVARSLDDRS